MAPNKKAINFCPIKYQKFLSGKWTNILDNNIILAFNTINNLIKTINDKTTKKKL